MSSDDPDWQKSIRTQNGYIQVCSSIPFLFSGLRLLKCDYPPSIKCDNRYGIVNCIVSTIKGGVDTSKRRCINNWFATCSYICDQSQRQDKCPTQEQRVQEPLEHFNTRWLQANFCYHKMYSLQCFSRAVTYKPKVPVVVEARQPLNV